MKIIAVDQSYTCSGIVIFDDGEMHFADTFTTTKEKDTFDRAWELTEHIRAIALNCKPDAIAFEGLAFSKLGNATRDLAGLQFTAINVLRNIDEHKIIIIPPNTVKKIATGSGKAKKPEMFEALPQKTKTFLVENMGLKKTKGLYDVTDAYWIGKCAEMVINGELKV